MERPSVESLRDAHAAISRAIRFKPPGSPAAQAILTLRQGIDELEEWQKELGSLDELRTGKIPGDAGAAGSPVM